MLHSPIHPPSLPPLPALPQIVSDIYAMVGSGSGAEGAAEVERRLTAMPQP